MSQTLTELQKQLDDALQLINENDLLSAPLKLETGVSDNVLNIEFAKSDSLLAQCEQVCEQFQSEKPTLRIIHHFACSGGTLISKCLSAMPNVFLLSEVHPHSDLHLGGGKPKYLPSDISSLIKYANVPNYSELAADIFVSNIIKTYDHVGLYGGTLILRDHTHSDFCVGAKATDMPVVISLLEPYFQIKNIVTIRNPIDAYLSLVKNNWKHFKPFSFEEYCKRFIEMTQFYSDSDVYRYEDFVREPSLVMQQMCTSLSLHYSDYFMDIFDVFQVTGDSGRSSSIISERPRRGLPADFIEEVQASSSFKIISKNFNY